MLPKLFLLAAILGLLSAPPLAAATFDVTASVDRTEVELGESLRYTLTMTVNGRLDFPVQIDPPKFEGFQAQGPGRQTSSSWVNGAVTEQHTFVWDLVPIKAGTLMIPAIKANAKDASTGEVIKSTPAFSIKVKRPKNAYTGSAPQAPGPLPTYEVQQQAQATPELDDTGLRDIKGNRGLPWAQLGMLFGAFGAVMALLVWWARRPSLAEEDLAPQIADPEALALMRLEKAQQIYKAGKEADLALAVHELLRDYLQQKYRLWQGTTLAEAHRIALRRDGALVPSMAELKGRLESLVFGKAKGAEGDPELIFEDSKLFIQGIREVRRGGPRLSLLAQDLEKALKTKDALEMMKDAFLGYMKAEHGVYEREALQQKLARALSGMETPRLLQTAEQILAPGVSKKDPRDIKDAFLTLARALGRGKTEE